MENLLKVRNLCAFIALEFKRLTAVLLAFTLVVAQVCTAGANAQLDGPDFVSPLIEHEVSDGGPIGDVEIFNASVVDNDELASVQLFYRYAGETEYTRINMRQIASSSNYTARVLTSSATDETSGIEYYIRAEDVAGNIVLKGFAFQPLQRKFEKATAAELPVQTTAVPETESQINWLYVALGVLVVGGIAAAVGGGDGGDDPVEPPSNIATVTITSEPIVGLR